MEGGRIQSVLIVDDFPVTAHGIRDILKRGIPGLRFVLAESAPQALECLWHDSFDLILLDLSLGGRDGFELLPEIRKHDPKTPTLIISMYGEEIYAVRALKAGSAGYLKKDAPIAEIIAAVKQVLAGKRYVSPKAAESLARHLEKATDRPTHESLSGREFEVLCLIGRGRSMKQIAADLRLSIKTVSTYRARILKRMGLNSTADLIRYCIRAKLCEE